MHDTIKPSTPQELLHLSEEPFRSDVISAGQEFAHFGVRGMRWGVRKKESSSSEDSGPEPYYQEDHSSGEGSHRGRKIATGLAITALVGTGAVFAGSYMVKSGKAPISTISTVKKAAESTAGAFVPKASQIFEGQKYAKYTMTHLGGVRIP